MKDPWIAGKFWKQRKGMERPIHKVLIGVKKLVYVLELNTAYRHL